MYYIICSCPRSGSSLLAEALMAMGAGKPEEYFNPVIHTKSTIAAREDFMKPTPQGYIERLKQEHTANGIFGIKIDYTFLARFPDGIARLPEFFPGAKYISITRRNILRQAISANRAIQTQAWTAQLPQKKNPHFSYLGILKHVMLTAQEIELWERFYAMHGITPLRILYEDLDEHYEQTMQQVVSYLGINGAIPPPPLKKQSDTLTEVWVTRCVSIFRSSGPLTRALRFLAQRF